MTQVMVGLVLTFIVIGSISFAIYAVFQIFTTLSWKQINALRDKRYIETEEITLPEVNVKIAELTARRLIAGKYNKYHILTEEERYLENRIEAWERQKLRLETDVLLSRN